MDLSGISHIQYLQQWGFAALGNWSFVREFPKQGAQPAAAFPSHCSPLSGQINTQVIPRNTSQQSYGAAVNWWGKGQQNKMGRQKNNFPRSIPCAVLANAAPEVKYRVRTCAKGQAALEQGSCVPASSQTDTVIIETSISYGSANCAESAAQDPPAFQVLHQGGQGAAGRGKLTSQHSVFGSQSKFLKRSTGRWGCFCRGASHLVSPSRADSAAHNLKHILQAEPSSSHLCFGGKVSLQHRQKL